MTCRPTRPPVHGVVRRILLPLAAAALLGGCYYSPYGAYGGYDPGYGYAAYPAYPAYYAAPAVVSGGVFVGGGGRGFYR